MVAFWEFHPALDVVVIHQRLIKVILTLISMVPVLIRTIPDSRSGRSSFVSDLTAVIFNFSSIGVDCYSRSQPGEAELYNSHYGTGLRLRRCF